MLANQRHELVCRDQKCDRVDESQQSQNDEPRQPIGISQREKFLEKWLACYHSEIRITSGDEVQRSTRMQ